MEWIEVSKAAEQLGVDARQVRRLAAAGQLEASRFGRQWLISSQAVHERAAHQPSPGRPLSPETVWLMLGLTGTCMQRRLGGQPAEMVIADRKVRHRLRLLVVEGAGRQDWSAWLRHRADARRIWVHPGVTERLIADERVHQPDVSELLGLSSTARGRLYIDAADFDDVIAEYRVHPDPEGEHVMMVIPDLPEDFAAKSATALYAAAVVDMLDSLDAREHHAAAEAIESAVAEMGAAVAGLAR